MKPRKHLATTPVPPEPTTIPPASTPVPPTPEPALVVAAPQAIAIAEPHGLRPDAPPYAVHGPHAVGTREFTIETAGRTAPVTVWYPARNPAGEPEEITYSMDIGDAGMKPFPVRGSALLDAQPDTTGAPYPLVVYSHGLFLYRQTAAYLAEHLASQGFVVIAGNHEDNWGTFGQPWDKSYVSRPADITAWIDFAETLNAQGGDLEGMIDSDRVGITGHSFGGYTALAAAGARFDHNWFLDVLCPAGPLAPDDILNECSWLRDKLPDIAAQAGLDAVPEGLWPNWGDPRVDAIAITAPATRSGPAGNAAVTVPALLLVGSADSIINVKLNANDTYNSLGSPHKILVKLENGGHALFINDCEAATGMADVAYIYCSDPIWDMDRAHDLHNHFTTAFLLAELKGDAEAAKALAPGNVAFPGITYETTANGAAPTAKLEEATVTKIEALVDKTMQNNQVPGIAVGVVKDGQVVYAKGFGVAEAGTDRAMTPQTLFPMASLSKQFTTDANMQLVEQGKIDLDAPLTAYLPDFKMADPRYKDITIRHLLADISGMPDWKESDWDYTRRTTSPEALHEAIGALATYELTGDPGKAEYLYSNAGFDLLGDVVAKVTGQSFEEVMQKQFFDPLGMASSSFLLADADPAATTKFHWKDETGKVVAGAEFLEYDQVHTPCGGLLSNIEDMSRWMLFNLNKGELDGQRILDPASYDAMWTPQTDADWGMGGMFQKWGLGWELAELDGHPFAWWGGLMAGGTSTMILAPEDGLGVVVVANASPSQSYDTPWYAVDLATALTSELLGINE